MIARRFSFVGQVRGLDHAQPGPDLRKHPLPVSGLRTYRLRPSRLVFWLGIAFAIFLGGVVLGLELRGFSEIATARRMLP